MTTQEILIVEDNPILQRHLKKILTEKGFVCIFAANEDEAMQRLSKNIFAVVADIDLSEGGGEPDGGIKLARFMFEKKWNIPVILISQTPWAHIPFHSTNLNFNNIKKEYHIHSIMDRNDSHFREDLIAELQKIHKRAGKI